MNTQSVLADFARIAHPIIREYFRADSCIASTAITIAVMKHFDIPAVEFPCRALVFNKAFMVRMRKEGHWPSPEETVEWTSGPDNAWSVGVGFPKTAEPYVGHLVAIVDNKYLVDASIDQATRPAKELFLPPVLVTPITRNFRRNKEKFELTNEHGERLIYEPRPKDKVYLQAPDWTDTSRHTRPVLRIIAAMNS